MFGPLLDVLSEAMVMMGGGAVVGGAKAGEMQEKKGEEGGSGYPRGKQSENIQAPLFEELPLYAQYV